MSVGSLTRGLSALYEDAQLQILGLISARLARGAEAPSWAMDKLLELGYLQQDARGVVNQTKRKAIQQVTQLIAEAYGAGAPGLGLEAFDVQAGRGRVSEAQKVLVDEAARFINRGSVQVLRSVDDIYRSVITRASGGELTGVSTRVQVMQRALDMFADKGVTGFVDRRGRQWEMQAYTDMAVRTVTHHASTEGHLNSLAANGNDLVIVSDHKGECPTCRKWEGKVLSISGGDPDRPSVAQARAAGLEHPGCRHRYGIYLPGITRAPEPQGKPEDYELIQKQRGMERKVRALRRREAVAVTPEAKADARRKLRDEQARLREHVAAHDLKRRSDRERVMEGRAGQAPALPVKKPRRPAKPKPPKEMNEDEHYDLYLKHSRDHRSDGLTWYTRGGHARINDYLRTGNLPSVPRRYVAGVPGLDEKVLQSIRDMDNTFAAKPLSFDYDLIVYRGIGAYDWDPGKVGSYVLDNGFASTSVTKSVTDEFLGEGWAVEIVAKKGVKFMLGTEQEHELIINRGTPMKVLSVDRENRIARLEVSP